MDSININNNKIKQFAPIVLFTYVRLEHTKKTIEALRNNIYAKDSELYIYSDGAKNTEAENKVNELREYLKTVDGFKKIKIIEREKNWGLAKNIIDGITNIINEHGKIIVVEDDIITSKFFLKYMNDALVVYENEKKVIAISGYNYTMENNISDTYFLPIFSCWGWATWERSWENYERNPQELIKKYDKKMIKEFNIDNNVKYWNQVKDNANGSLYTWAIFFYELVFRMNGVCLYPKISLVNNIGFDDTGEHCREETVYNCEIYDREIDVSKIEIDVDEKMYDLTKKYLYGVFYPSIIKKIKKRIKRIYKWYMN